MHSTTIVFFLYLLCIACASPLHLKARHEGDKLISRDLPSRFNTAVLRKRVDVEMEKAVLDAWDNDRGICLSKGERWSRYQLKKHFTNPALYRLFPANHVVRGPHHEKPHLDGPLDVPEGPVDAWIEAWVTQDNAEFEDALGEIRRVRMLHDYLGSAVRHGGGRTTVYIVMRILNASSWDMSMDRDDHEARYWDHINKILQPLHNLLGHNAG